jgi:hypothetical protein
MALSTSVIIATSPLGERKVFSTVKAAILSAGLSYQHLISPSTGDGKANILSKIKEKDGTFRDGNGFEHRGWKFEKFQINKTETIFKRSQTSSINSERLFRKTDNMVENSKDTYYILFDKGSPEYPAVYHARGFVNDQPNAIATLMDRDKEVIRKQLWDRGFRPRKPKNGNDPLILEVWEVLN